MAIAVYRPNEALAEKSTFEIMPMAFQLADKLSTTEFVPAGLRNRPAAIAAAILTGHEVGLPPMASLQHINVIDGKPSLSAAGQRALILARGHKIWVEEQTLTRARVCSQRRGEERISETVWTLDDARRAQLINKQNWQRYPRNMLVARATGDNARGNFMDVLGGIPYNTEEVEDMVDGGPLPADTTVTPPTSRTRRASRAATAPAASTEPPPGPDPEPIEAQVVEQPLAGEPAAGETLTLAQQIAILCRELGIERANLIFAVTGQTSGRNITRPQAVDVLAAARAIQRGETQLIRKDGVWQILPLASPTPEPQRSAPEAPASSADQPDRLL